MAYHKPADKERILVGGKKEYSESTQIANEFEEYIYEVCQELAKHDEATLRELGITCNEDVWTKKRNPWSYELREQGILYQISCSPEGNPISFIARQFGETPEMATIRNVSGGMIFGSLSSMIFRSEIKAVTRKMQAREFSFTGNETMDNTDKYIESILPEPDKKVVFDEVKGQYDTIYKSDEERPKCIYNTQDPENYPGYINKDGSPFLGNEPTSVTTYPSFDEAAEEMTIKIEGFKKAWNNRIDLLMQQSKEGPKL